MQIIKPLALSLIHRTLFQHQRYQLCVSPILFFSLSEPQKIISEQVAWQKVMASLGEGEVLDIGAPKHQAEVLLSGKAMPIQGAEVSHFKVGLKVGEVLEKHAMVVGEQSWQLQSNNWQLSNPEKVQATELSWANSYGGPGYVDNPSGLGYLDANELNKDMCIRLPSIRSIDDEYHKFSTIRDAHAACVGFGPLSLTSPIRQQRAGTYDDHWLANDYPGLAHDHHPAIHNVAQPDQWLASNLIGNEPYTITGMHAQKAEIKGHLPAMRMRAFLQKKDTGSHDLIELNLCADTLWFFPNQDMGLLISRGVCDVDDSDSLDVQSLMLAYERSADKPRDLAYYKDVHQLRTNPETAVAHIMHDSQLTPCKTQAQLELEQAEVEKEMQRRQKIISANAEPINEKVGAALDQPGFSLTDIASLELSVPETDFAKLGELAAKASKLANLYKDESNSSDIDLSKLNAMLRKLEQLPLEDWGTIKVKENDLEALVLKVSEFAQQCQKASEANPDSASEQILNLSKGLNEKLSDTPFTSLKSIESNGIKLDEVTRATQELLNEFKTVSGQIEAQPSCGNLDLSDPNKTLESTPNDHLSLATGANTQAQIQKLESSLPQNQSKLQAVNDPIKQMPIIAPEAIARGDIDLSGVIAAANNITEQAKSDAELGLSAIRESLGASITDDDDTQHSQEALPLVAIEDQLRSRFEPVRAREGMSAEHLKQAAKNQHLARLAAQEDSSDANRFATDARDYLRAKVIERIDAGQTLTGLDLSGANLQGLNLSHHDLSGTLFESADLTACDLRGANLTESVLTGAMIDGCVFDESDLSGANLSAITATGVSFKSCCFDQTRFIHTALHHSDFSSSSFRSLLMLEAIMATCDFQECEFNETQWVQCELIGANWSSAYFSGCIFIKSQLGAAVFSNALLSRCVFIEVSAPGSYFDHSKLDCVQFAGDCELIGSDFSQCSAKTVGLLGIDLSDVDFTDSIFCESNFTNGIFTGASLERAGFLRCVFSGAKLSSVNASDTNFMESLLRKSQWQDTDLSRGNFFSADVKHSLFANCNLKHVRNMGAMAEVRL